MALIGYVRCSSSDQTIIQQIDQLRAAGCKRIYRDKAIRATAKKRPGLLAVKKALKRGDTFVVTAIDRAFRSTMEAILFLDDVTTEGITFRSLAQNIDTRTPEGRKWYIDAASWAEYERAVIARRTREKMAAAKLRGQKFGRPRKLKPKQIARVAAKLRANPDLTFASLAAALGVSPRTLSRALAELEGNEKGNNR